jgi:hypothetical protein
MNDAGFRLRHSCLSGGECGKGEYGLKEPFERGFYEGRQTEKVVSCPGMLVALMVPE